MRSGFVNGVPYKEWMRQYQRKYFLEHKEKNRLYRYEYNKKWVKEHPEKAREYWKKNSRKHRKAIIISNRKRRYEKLGFTLDDYDKMFNSQNGKCLICKKELKEKHGRLTHLDHCHKSGLIRAILCNRCNDGLGCFDDNITILKEAIRYLKYYQIKNITNKKEDIRQLDFLLE